MHQLDRRLVERRFDRAASGFDAADFVHAHTRQSLFERMRPMVVEAKTVLDLGCATGSASRELSRHFRGSRLLSVDLSRAMLQGTKRKRRLFSRQAVIQADALALPFADGSIDVVFSNLLLPWTSQPDRVFAEVSRVLREGGLFLFATLGPDSLGSIRQSWQNLDSNEHVNRFDDMHDVGDGLLRAGLADPVLDTDRLTVSYSTTGSLFRDLTAVGARNSLLRRQRSLGGRRRFEQMRRCLEETAADGKINIELELVYGHCWGTPAGSRDNAFRVDAGSIPVRRQ